MYLLFNVGRYDTISTCFDGTKLQKYAIDKRQSGLLLAKDNDSNFYFEWQIHQTIMFFLFSSESLWLYPAHSCVYKAHVFFPRRRWLIPGGIPLNFVIALQLQGYPQKS